MKKLLAFVAIFALLLSAGTVLTAAEELPYAGRYRSWKAGAYADGTGEDFAPVGDVKIEWSPDFQSRVDLSDGDLGDWVGAGIASTPITQNNMISRVGNDNKPQTGGVGDADNGMPFDWGMVTYYAADENYLYMAFDVTECTFAYGDTPPNQNGDVIQLTIDFGCKIEDAIARDPEWGFEPLGVTYSLSCKEDGAPLVIHRQDSEDDGNLSAANGDAVLGAARKTDKGWSVELALGWDMLYRDYVWKAWETDPRVFVGAMEKIPLRLGVTLSYMSRNVTGGTVTWAAGTCTDQWKDQSGAPCVSGTVYDNGMHLWLDSDMAQNLACDGVVGVFEHVTMGAVLTTEGETYPVEPEPMPPVWVETPAVDPADTMDEELQAILEKYGCTSAVGLGSLTALLTLAAAAYVIRKRK